MEPDIPDLQNWLVKRKIAIDQLKALVEDLNKYHKGAKVASVVGRLTTIGGVLAGLGLLALTPVSGGATTVPGIIAVGSSVSGAGADIGGKIIKKRKTKKKLTEVEHIFEEDRKCTGVIQAIVQQVEQAERDVEDFLEERVKSKVTEVCGEEVTGGNSQPDNNEGPEVIQKLEVLHKTIKSKGSTQVQNRGTSILVEMLLKFGPKIKSGIKIAQTLNILNVRRFVNIGKTVLSPVAESLPRIGAGTDNIARTGTSVLQLGKAVRYGGVVISIALLPLDVYNLVKTSLELRKGDGHEASRMIEGQIKDLEDEMANVKDYLREKVNELNNFVLLINSILSNGCGEDMGSLINQILKRLLGLKKFVKAFDRLDILSHPTYKDNRSSSNISAALVNCEGTNDSLYKRMSTYIWCAWNMGHNTAIFLQNTSLTDDPILWTLFGVSINSFNSVNGQGVSILLPLNFPGDIVSTNEYHSNDKDWNGRCLVVNVKYRENDYSFVSLLAPDEKLSRDLFMKEMAAFVKQNCTGKVFLGANFRFELQTMTVVVKNRVSKKMPFSVIKGLIPYNDVSEYLIQKPSQTDIPMLMTYQVLKDYSLIKPKDIDVKWNLCCGIQVSTDDYRDQLKPITSLGLSDLWAKKNPGRLEFSVEKEVSRRVVNCNQSLDFFISPEIEEDIVECYLDHTLRFLGFLPQSVLVARGS